MGVIVVLALDVLHRVRPGVRVASRAEDRVKVRLEVALMERGEWLATGCDDQLAVIGGHLDLAGDAGADVPRTEPERAGLIGTEAVQQDGELLLAVDFEHVRAIGRPAVLRDEQIIANLQVHRDRNHQGRRAEVGPVATDHDLRFLREVLRREPGR